MRDICDAEGEGSITDVESDILIALMGPDNSAVFNDYGWGDLLKALRKGYELGARDALDGAPGREPW